MSDPVSLASLFDDAEQAALRGDFAAAARLLGEAARVQEATLGPHHLDLANTLNNLAVAHERSGQLEAAEREYRRAYAIAARTLPADDPLVATSAQNLREFCEANGRTVEAPALSLADADVGNAMTVRIVGPLPPIQADVPTVPIEPLAITFAEAGAMPAAPPPREAVAPSPAASIATPTPVAQPARPAPESKPVPSKTVATARPVPPTKSVAPAKPTPTPAPVVAPSRLAAPATAPAVSSRGLSIPVVVALGAVAGLVIWLLVGRGPSAPPVEPDTAAPVPPPAGATPPPAPADVPVPRPATPPPAAAQPAPSPGPATSASTATPTASSADGSITIGQARLCASLSPTYRCEAVSGTARPGRLVFYTRLVATRDTSVVHRWYRGDTLRQSVRLDIPARRQGFRTFSRSTVWGGDGDWRVELRTRDGQLLHTERFTVR